MCEVQCKAASWSLCHRLKIWLAIVTDGGAFTCSGQEPAMLILKALGRIHRMWQRKPAEIWMDKNSTVIQQWKQCNEVDVMYNGWREENRLWRITISFKHIKGSKDSKWAEVEDDSSSDDVPASHGTEGALLITSWHWSQFQELQVSSTNRLKKKSPPKNNTQCQRAKDQFWNRLLQSVAPWNVKSVNGEPHSRPAEFKDSGRPLAQGYEARAPVLATRCLCSDSRNLCHHNRLKLGGGSGEGRRPRPSSEGQRYTFATQTPNPTTSPFRQIWKFPYLQARMATRSPT